MVKTLRAQEKNSGCFLAASTKTAVGTTPSFSDAHRGARHRPAPEVGLLLSRNKHLNWVPVSKGMPCSYVW